MNWREEINYWLSIYARLDKLSSTDKNLERIRFLVKEKIERALDNEELNFQHTIEQLLIGVPSNNEGDK